MTATGLRIHLQNRWRMAIDLRYSMLIQTRSQTRSVTTKHCHLRSHLWIPTRLVINSQNQTRFLTRFLTLTAIDSQSQKLNRKPTR